MLRLSKKRFLLTIWVILTLSFIFYSEYLLYKLNTKKWDQIPCRNPRECTRILLVADPQIIGNLNEVFHPVTPFTILDSDRYLKNTYSVAYQFVKPDVILFLGDLTDEGHIASDDDFYNYVRRLFQIFLYPFENDQHVKHIWIPGDNDIGGEDTKVTLKKLQRFDRAFSQPSLNKINNITIFKVNRLTSIIPDYKKERDFYDTSNIFVGISHMPLMFLPSPFVRQVVDKMLPHIFFTGHEHKSMIISTDGLLRQDYQITPVTPDNTQVYEFTLGVTDMYEIMIPTCSYRMGTNKIGYGFAVIENNELKFTILWSPHRFEHLAIYLVLIVLPLLIFCISKSCGCVIKLSKSNYKYSYL